MSRVTMQRVAQRAGVSLTTVSYVLNDRPASGIPAHTRERVRRAAAELGYRPNAVARSLARGQTHTIGLVLATLTNPFFAELADGLHHGAHALGYDLHVALDGGSFEQEAEHLERFLDRRVDGVLVWAGLGRNRYPAHRLLEAQQTPLVVLGRHVEDDVTSFVDVDRGAGIDRAVEHLVRLGRTRIGYVGCEEEVTTTMTLKYRAFLAALERRNLAPAIVASSPLSSLTSERLRAVGYEAGTQVAQARELPDAVLCGGDLFAFGTISALAEHGIRVPDDVAVVGYDGVADGAFSRPRLTTIAQPIAGLVKHGLEILLQSRASPGAAPTQLTLQPELIVRESCGAPQPPALGRA